MNAASGLPARVASACSLSRSGPIVPCEPAAASVWHELHALPLNTASPEAPLVRPGAAAAGPDFAHFANAAAESTFACERISPCPSPHSSVQMTGYVPIRSGVMCSVGWMPGTTSCFCENCGTQNEWMTSLDVMCRTTERLTGSIRMSDSFALEQSAAPFGIGLQP